MGLTVALVACSGQVAGDDDTSEPGTADAAPGGSGADAGPQSGGPDAAPTPTNPTYPPGPYGVVKGATISNRTWMGYMDTAADADKDPFNEPPHPISLADFYTGNDPHSRLLLMVQSAGWCGPCQEEAAHLPQVSAQWQPRGIHFMTAMWQNPDGSPGTTDYSKEWGTMFHQDTPVVADPDSLAGDGFGGDGIPFFILVDTKDMKILDFPWSADLPDVYQQYAN